MNILKKRAYRYAHEPSHFEMSGCPKCGATGEKITWSEFKEHLWCYVCEIDFIPECAGIFDGPIPIEASAMMGITFEVITIKSGKFLVPWLKNGKLVYKKHDPNNLSPLQSLQPK